jgi:hypothetical protein
MRVKLLGWVLVYVPKWWGRGWKVKLRLKLIR